MSAAPKLGRGFEWFVAWRHIRDPERHTRRMLFLGLTIVALSLVALTVAHFLGREARAGEGILRVRPSLLSENIWTVGIIGLIVGLVLTYWGALFALFTVFTAISMFGVFIGTSAPIVTLSVMSGFEADLKGKIRGATADVVITRSDDRPFGAWDEVRKKIADVRGVVASTPYIEADVMIKSGATPGGITLRGIDPATAPGVLDVARSLREGKLEHLDNPQQIKMSARTRGGGMLGALDDEEKGGPGGEAEAAPPVTEGLPPGIILGEELYARTLRVFVGSDVDVLCPLCGMGPSGPVPRMWPFRVAGHFYSGMYQFDSKLAYVSLTAAQRFLDMPDEVTGVDVRTSSPEKAPQVADDIRQRLGKDYDVRSWEELNKGLFGALRIEKIAMFVVLTFILLVASFSIISNLIMNVTQKGRELAILKAMGAGNAAILRVFFAEGLYIGLMGLVVGVATGIAGCKLLERYGPPLPTDVYYISSLPVVIRADEIAIVAGSALLLCCLATVYPAVLASRLRPVEGLRYE